MSHVQIGVLAKQHELILGHNEFLARCQALAVYNEFHFGHDN